MKIKNINGTSQSACSCGSWLKHWEKLSGQKAIYCQAFGCLNKDVAGAHVRKAVDSDANGYIYPLCNFHSRVVGELAVADAFMLVPADPHQTCARPSA
jgi:hypothetical protein